jgi:hypothetical protein
VDVEFPAGGTAPGYSIIVFALLSYAGLEREDRVAVFARFNKLLARYFRGLTGGFLVTRNKTASSAESMG